MKRGAILKLIAWLIGGVFLLYLVVGVVSLVINLGIKFWYLVVLIVAAFPAYFIGRHIMMKRYFSSPEFLAHKDLIASVVQEHNEISEYVAEIRRSGKFSLGKSSTGIQSHLATFENTSRYGYKRDRHQVDSVNNLVHHASLQVVRNASVEPIRYLIKYFDIAATEQKLAEVESLGESISRLENAIGNLKLREREISEEIAPPSFILKHYLKEFQAQIGLSIPSLSVPYPVYSFQYLSAGGNSSQVSDITLNSATIDAVIETLSERVKFLKSAAGQRALMTASLREKIKVRDGHACKICAISIVDEPHLLLEIDHIKPVSKGGLSIEENLQTLCWK